MKEISRGAEAVILKDKDTVIKRRLEKSYRIPEIDAPLIKRRTKAEAKIMTKLSNIINVPKIFGSDSSEIQMEFIPGQKLRDILDKTPALASKAGKMLANLHDTNIIHGDLTTSNMILNKDLFFIDFGLSFHSFRIEDKAVDIHLFKQALESKHFRVFDKAYSNFIKAYNPKDKSKILDRLEIVESRGRYKGK